MRRWIKPERRYFIINIDEPYAEEIYKVLKRGETRKGKWPEGDISFEEWIELTWPNEGVTLQKESILGAERPKPSKKRGIARIKRRV
jgi:hypothetical protein